MIGDFNMVENPLDMSTSSCSQPIGLKEELAWAAMKNKYNIEDYFSRNEGHLYFGDNLRASKYWLDSRQILILLKLNSKSIFPHYAIQDYGGFYFLRPPPSLFPN